MNTQDGQDSGAPHVPPEHTHTPEQSAPPHATNHYPSGTTVPTFSSPPTAGGATPPSWPGYPPTVTGYTTPTNPPSGGYVPPGLTLPPYGYTPPPPQYVPNRWQSRPGFLQSLGGRILIVAGAAVLALALLGGVGIVVARVLNPGPQGYLWTSNTAVDFVQWTEDSSHHLNGTLQSVSATPDNTMNSNTAAFTGVHDGSKVSITFSVLGFSSTVTGTLNGNALTLAVPDQDGTLATNVFHLASVQDYNTAVNTLRRRIESQAAAAQAAQATADTQQAQAQATASAQAQLDQAVTSANAKLSGDLSTLSSDVQSLKTNTDFSDALDAYAKDWAQMQKDYQQEQTDYANGCGEGGYNAGSVSYDAGVVNYDLGTIQYDDGTLSYDQGAMSGPLGNVQSDIKSVQADWKSLQSAVAADTTGNVAAQFSQKDIDTAVGNAQKQVDASNAALSQAQSQGTQYDKKAAQMNTDAQNLANSMHC